MTMASVVLGEKAAQEMNDERLVTKEAIDDILKYYHYKPITVPEEVTGQIEQIEYCLRPYGIMRRDVRLTDDWYKNAFGPMIAFRKSNGLPEAMLPKRFRGYYYKEGSKKVGLNRKTAELFKEDGLCFYRPLPQKKLGIPDLLLYMKKCFTIPDVIFFIGLTLLVTLAGMIYPELVRILSGFVLNSKNGILLLATAVYMFTSTIVTKLFEISKGLLMDRIQKMISLSVEAAVMLRILGLQPSFFREYNSGNLSSRVDSVNQLSSMLISTILSTGITSLASLLYITRIFQYAPSLVAPALVIIGVTLTITIVTSVMQIGLSRRSMEQSAKERGMSYAMINGVQKIKLAGAEKRAFARWAKLYSVGASISYNPPFFLKVNAALITLITTLGTAVLYYIATATYVANKDFMAFSASYGVVMGAFSSLAGIALSFAQIKPTLNMAEPILKAEPEYLEGKEILTSISGQIEVNNLFFRYNESMPYVVDNLSLKIKKGEYLALVGATGCGKSTLVRLLLAFEKPERGSIFYDGKDLGGVDVRSLREHIGVVTQDGSLFQGDIYSNITISAPHLTLDEAWEAAEIAGIADDIRDMPMGMFTMIGEGQGGISGGQKQRLMIARAVAPKPKVLILDEATSALDNKTQKMVSDALDKLDCTRIVIAHRLSTIQNCDRILVLADGKIKEEGTYDELIRKGGYFAELVERQRLDTSSDQK